MRDAGRGDQGRHRVPEGSTVLSELAPPRLPEEPRLPPDPTGLTAEELLGGPDDGAWTDSVARGLRVPGVVAEDWRLTDCRFEGCDLSGARFSNLLLVRVELIDCRLTAVDLGGAQFRDVRFVDCRLEDANFRLVKAERVAFEGCVLTGADFAGASMPGVRFERCALDGIELHKAQLEGATFPDCAMGSIKGLDGLRGARVSSTQAIDLAFAMAAELGLTIVDERE